MVADKQNKENEPAEGIGSPARPATHWNRQYYDNMAFHFWEPHHIGRTRNPDSRIRTEAEATAKLRGLEVVLNHQMELFFRLAPDGLVRDLFACAFGAEFADTYRVIGREFHQLFAVAGLTQPDLLFEGTRATVAIELKLGAKTSLEQIVKYATLFALMQPARQAYGLLLMGPKGFPDLWRDKFQTPADISPALAGLDRSTLPGKLRRHLECRGDDVDALLAQMKVGFLSYENFHTRLADEAKRGPHHDTYQRLLAGMMAELEERGLARASGDLHAKASRDAQE